MGVAPLILVANPGSASRKYALFAGVDLRASLHVEITDGQIICNLQHKKEHTIVQAQIDELTEAASHVDEVLRKHNVLREHETIGLIGLRIVAPSSFFLQDHEVTDEVVEQLHTLEPRAPLHISASLSELETLRSEFPDARIFGISDSAFHATKPDYAWNYGISLEDADKFEIKRFGYHGLSVASAVKSLHQAEKHAAKVIVCHLGSGASITAVRNGHSVDASMGYSPLEGLIMSTRSGTIDFTAAQVLKTALKLNDAELDEHLNKHSGLLGLGGSPDIRELLQREADGDHRAELALQTYVYTVQKTIGQMTAALGGVDALVFTGTVGERSAPIRERITASLHYLELELDSEVNSKVTDPIEPVSINKVAHSKPIYVVPADEAGEIAAHVMELI